MVVGLGNPGPELAATRHNLGYRVVSELVEKWSALPLESVCNSDLFRAETRYLARPRTFMNRSGAALACLVERLGTPPEDVLIVYDDVDLPLGRLRLKARGSAGGHRGMESVLEALRTDGVPRLRLGIGRPPAGIEVAEFVLTPFEPAEEKLAAELVGRGATAVELWYELGTERAMSRVNAPILESSTF